MADRAPSAPQPDAWQPPRVQDHVHVLLAPQLVHDLLAKLQAFLVDLLPEQPLVPRLPVATLQILGHDIRNVLHQPRHDGMPARDKTVDLLLQRE
eukprot:5840408-Lingulodinium_polyedra.AAC.1